MAVLKWSYHAGYKWWESSDGFGKLAVQRARKKWYLMRVPWIGSPSVISTHASKAEAFAAATPKKNPPLIV